MDTTNKFTGFFTSQQFQSLKEFQSKLNEFEQSTGSIYVMKNSNRLPENSVDSEKLVYSSLEYVCYHFDVYDSSSQERQQVEKTSGGSCSSHLSLLAVNGNLWITNYDMVHTHLPLPDTSQIDSKMKILQYKESGNRDLLTEVQIVKDNTELISSAPDVSSEDAQNQSLDPSPQSSDSMKPVCDRKSTARDRIYVWNKQTRGMKLAPFIRRLAELASSGSEEDFRKHFEELENLVQIWASGLVSELLSAPLPVPNTIVPSVVDVSETLTPPNSSAQSVIDYSNISTNLTATTSTVCNVSPSKSFRFNHTEEYSAAPVELKSINIPLTPVDYLQFHNKTLPNGGGFQVEKESLTPALGNLANSSQSVCENVMQPMLSTPTNSFVSPNQAVFPHLPPLAPGDVVQKLQKSIPLPILKPKTVVTVQHSTNKRGRPLLSENKIAKVIRVSESPEEPYSSSSWSSLILEGDKCPYFLYIEDANFCFSSVQEAWVPIDQKMTSVEY